MIYALGKPGEPVRCYFETDDVARGVMQLQEGEVGVAVDKVEHWAAIDEDGQGVTVFQEPLRFSQDSIRVRRNALLSSCDWTVLPDSPMTPEARAEWIAYRQELREITTSQPDATLATVNWPSEPGAN